MAKRSSTTSKEIGDHTKPVDPYVYYIYVCIDPWSDVGRAHVKTCEPKSRNKQHNIKHKYYINLIVDVGFS